MLSIDRVLRQDRLLRALTGLKRKAFEALLPRFSAVYQQRLLNRPRQRAIGGGRKSRLHRPQDKLFYILFYFKCYPTFDVAGVLFNIDRSQACTWMHRLQPILEAAFGEHLVLTRAQTG
ncbi:transposase family protein [Nodosilinea sp. LEGE 07298]|uniref:helix-turn-helix domain-containing protein n=1 Tax=Nodosilinea sp. LEGE 07298 TaxID=2777970 RepID=UPI00188230E1|nr:transposase family protein [Nodosilinea sp. LEGE 07298]MBE9114186.1 transposase family protein [Nodosilinea sp. LEGE 07298]